LSGAAPDAPPVSAPAGGALMNAEHVTKEFGGLVAVNDVSVDVPRHSIV
jgi:ABC-type branched-subunit amino acid transport system ATPase component